MAGITGSIESLPTRLADQWTRARSRLALIRHSRSVRRALLARLIATILCACIAMWVTRTLSDAAEMHEKWGPQTTVLVARHDIAPGAELRRSDIVEEPRPESLTPPDALTELAPGATVNALVLAGEPLVGARMTSDDDRLAPEGTTAIRLELSVSAPELARGDLVDILGPQSTPRPSEVDATPGDHETTDRRVDVISRGAVVLLPPTGEDPTIEVAVDEVDLPSVADAAFGGGVAVVRRSP